MDWPGDDIAALCRRAEKSLDQVDLTLASLNASLRVTALSMEQLGAAAATINALAADVRDIVARLTGEKP